MSEITRRSFATPSDKMLKVVACTAGYYICSVSIILFNKFLLSNSGFSFPYFVTLVYLVVKGLECGLMKWCLGLEGRQFNSWSEYFFKVVLVGASVATEICIRNLSFIYVTVALYTMVGATVPIWQLGWALAPCFKLEKFEIFLVLAIVAVALGLALVGYGATEVEPVGLFILLASVVLSGLNGVIIQGQLQNKSLLATDTASSTAQPLNPIVLTWEIAPWASLMALAFVLVFELSEMKSSEYFKSWAGLAPVLAGLCGSGTLVSIDIVLQRMVILYASALTLSITSSVKELGTVLLGMLVFGDTVTPIQALGLACTLGGVKLYGYSRWQQQKERNRLQHEMAEQKTVPAEADDCDKETAQLLSANTQ